MDNSMDRPPATWIREWLLAIEGLREASRKLSASYEQARRRYVAECGPMRDQAEEAAHHLGRLVPVPGESQEFLAGPSHRQVYCRLARHEETGEINLVVRDLANDWELAWPVDPAEEARKEWHEDDRIGIPGLDAEDVMAVFEGCE